MKTKTSIKIFLIPAILFAVFFAFGNEAKAAANWYVSPTGSANCASGCLVGAPCSLATVLTCNVVGDDNVILKDGTYTGTSLTVPWSGTEGHPITIKAENDGQAIVDGQNERKPLRIVTRHDITVEGIVFKNSNDSVAIVAYSDRITLKRISAYTSGSSGNFHVFDLSYSTYVLLEDCAASGIGRVMYDVMESSYVTLRRCWGAVVLNPGGGDSDVVQIYGSSHCIVENCVGTTASPSAVTSGVYLQTRYYNYNGTNYNKIYGNVMRNTSYASYQVQSEQHNIHDNEFKDNVGIGRAGIYQMGDSNFTFTNNTILSGDAKGGYFIHSWIDSGYTLDADWRVNAIAKNNVFKKNGTYDTGIYVGNSSLIQFFTHTYNDISGYGTTYYNTTAGTGEVTISPTFNTAQYGDGAYLMYPSNLTTSGEGGGPMGAKVLYRYVDGVLTSDVLWPWPMEDRIKAETGYSVTWEANGGLWKTLDGAYADNPPSAPSGLTVQ